MFRRDRPVTHWRAMNPTARAAQLRRRARHLRDLATAIEATPAMSLDVHAGDDTWIGPRPVLCRALLAAGQRQLHRAADDLRSTAYRFELLAEELDAAARFGIAG